MSTELGDGYDKLHESMFDPDCEARRSQGDRHANTNATFDYYEAFPPVQPKFEIGQYVAECGFNVPLINCLSEWQTAFDEGTAMLRSEMPQDYSGLSGLLFSERLTQQQFTGESDGFHKQLGSLVMRSLRDGELDPTEYMTKLRNSWTWQDEKLEHTRIAARYGALNLLEIRRESASHWRYIEGTNVSVFADPNVEGRYHFGVTPGDFPYIEGCRLDIGDYDSPIALRLHKTPFIARPFIEYYELIRNLPRFDRTQCPVIELQHGNDGKIYFLQYFKTGQKQNFTEPFELPNSDETYRTTDVRGVTLPSGVQMKLFVTPRCMIPNMEDQAIFCDGLQLRGTEVQLASKIARFILHGVYLSFKDNHYDASPLYRPQLAASLCDSGKNSSDFRTKVERSLERTSTLSRSAGFPYLNIKITSNGREAAIESDWTIRS